MVRVRSPVQSRSRAFGWDNRRNETTNRTGNRDDIMAKAKFERTKPHVNVGTIGHVDHGKTT
ncbi:MAG: elongation factor Tu, partial [Gemmatimonadota bacterium]|nr:elongation factor Tu [Gemmatimonadota bacterium]